MFREFLLSSSEAVQIENLHLSLKRRTKRKLADRDTDGDSQDSRDRDAFFERVQTFSVSFYFNAQCQSVTPWVAIFGEQDIDFKSSTTCTY